MKRLPFILLLSFAVHAEDAPPPKAPEKSEKSAPDKKPAAEKKPADAAPVFVPSEKISADQEVDFPADL